MPRPKHVREPLRPERCVAFRTWEAGVTAIALVWMAAIVSVAGIRSTLPTPDSIDAYAASHPLHGAAPEQRLRTVEYLAGQLRFLNHWQLRELNRRPALRGIYDAFTGTEKERFLQLSIAATIKQLLRTASALPAAEREPFINQAIHEMDAALFHEKSAGYNVKRVYGWLTEGLLEAFFSLPAGARTELRPVIKKTMPNASSRL